MDKSPFAARTLAPPPRTPPRLFPCATSLAVEASAPKELSYDSPSRLGPELVRPRAGGQLLRRLPGSLRGLPSPVATNGLPKARPSGETMGVLPRNTPASMRG